MRYLGALAGVLLLLASLAAAGSFTAEMDVDTYVDKDNPDQSFSGEDILWTASSDGQPTKQIYLSFINLFGSQGIFGPEAIESATLTLNATTVDKPGDIKAYLVKGPAYDTTTWSEKPEYESDVSASLIVEKDGSCTWDVTPLIRKAVETCTEGCPYSLALVAEDSASIGFTSKEASMEKKPTLEYVTAE